MEYFSTVYLPSPYLPDLAEAVPGLGARLSCALLSGRVADTGRALGCGVAVAPLYRGSMPISSVVSGRFSSIARGEAADTKVPGGLPP